MNIANRSIAAACAAAILIFNASSTHAQTTAATPAPAPAPAGAASAMPAAAPPAAMPASSGVSADQLVNAQQDPNSWLTYGRDLGAQRFSPLTQIDTSNASGLTLAWKKTLGPAITMEGTPIVSNGVEYVTTGKSAIFALDAKTGKTIWSYKYPLPVSSYAKACCNIDNRGVTLTGDKLVFGTLDAHLVALDAKTGKLDWNVTVESNAKAYSITSPPLPVKNLVITGAGGGEYPTRGFIAAYAADTGKLVWKHYTIPAKGEPGYETWQIPGGAARGGAPTWLPGTYDASRNTVYWGTGNPNPDWDAQGLKGKLLYASSTLALDADTGKLKWYYQYTPHNIWDYDSVSEAMLVDVPVNGTNVAAVAHADRNGYLYLLNRDTGKLIFAVPFLDKVTWGKVDRNSGAITLNPSIQAAANARKPYLVYPSVIGGKNWEPTAYDPQHHLLFIPALESSIVIIPAQKTDLNPKKGTFNGGAGFGKATFKGSISAWDLSTGKMVWKNYFKLPAFGGALATGRSRIRRPNERRIRCLQRPDR
ncbi:MAG: PQQ-binding-like beta-propeller repeat protein [Candidatus Eremiobacteraeota bacterium]|nr:PQQ-binding-like beta-propeller repeat protein [Candidatus Eremiobacteraeota bacterium]